MERNTNLLEETKDAIESAGRKPDDIIFIGSEKSGHQCTWEEFCVLANYEYDSWYGSPKVATDLIIVFADGQKMWRGEYDGSEWWEFSTPFKKPEVSKKIHVLVGDKFKWYTLEEMNNDRG